MQWNAFGDRNIGTNKIRDSWIFNNREMYKLISYISTVFLYLIEIYSLKYISYLTFFLFFQLCQCVLSSKPFFFNL